MKKLLLKSAIFIAVLVTVISCSTDAESVTVNETVSNKTKRSTLWDGVIGKALGTKYTVTANRAILINDLEQVLRSQGDTITIETLQIVQKTPINNPFERGYMLVGSDTRGTSIGVFLLLSQQNEFTMLRQRDMATATTCRGCATGCNLQYLTIDGKKVAYCNENGCVYDCEKTDSDAL